MSEWKEVSLSELGKTITGKTPSSQYPEDFGDEVPFITPSDSFEKKYISKSERFLSRSGSERLKDKIISSDSIMVTCIGSAMGKVAKNGLPSVTNQQINSIIVNEKFDSDYIYYLFKNNYAVFRNAASGSTAIPILNKTDFDNLRFKVELDLNEQRKMVSILSKIDDKIEINNQINQELEAMAKILYDYWFVQFDFPDQNGNPYKSSGGKMSYNPELKREIPEGWGVVTLGDFESKIITGKTPSRANSDNFGGEIPFITIGDIRGNTFIYSTSESLTDLGASVQQNKYLPEGSLCVSCIATVGEIGFTTEWSHTNQQINSIVFEDETNRYYLYFALKNYFENANASAKTGNTFANMNKEDFSGIRIILPNKEIKNNFHEISEPYFAQIKCLQGQNQELTQLRDWLLPMLMNGQVII
ncbi:restriction endonuclease subunit S [Streptococcus sp. HMSC067H01]|uniref:restriction endonuclease subunit S n=1 Tax=Streptococcus sp. HMSC067H01 TaxID=1739491 RepID=UPI0008CE8AF0|nr:restriction endonuclease subunit S [Streptococcus sp. HMSC067H01]OFP42662.1 restriction endonuclease subunit S [Streptococcus sp. HMSC067H01]